MEEEAQCAEQPAEDGRAGCSRSADQPAEEELNQCETPLGLDPTATPSFIQHAAAFQTQLHQVEEACRESHKPELPVDRT